MEPAVLDENFIGVHPSVEDACQEHAFPVALERVGIRERLVRVGIEADAMGFQELGIGTVAGHRKDEIVHEFLFALWGVN